MQKLEKTCCSSCLYRTLYVYIRDYVQEKNLTVLTFNYNIVNILTTAPLISTFCAANSYHMKVSRILPLFQFYNSFCKEFYTILLRRNYMLLL